MQIITQENQKELKEHGNYAFPVNISIEKIESYETGTFLWHWHPEIELTLILSGQIEYQIEDNTYILSTGDGVFCNGNSLCTFTGEIK
jgi:quercetin dioxygenase-like cupin family protein